jgi:hypothetical protein
MPMYVIYPDLIQIGIFIVTLVGLCYTVFKGRPDEKVYQTFSLDAWQKQPPTIAHSERLLLSN